ncbi:hypothetical protein D3C87_1343530 [compost metagenome]
MVFTDTCPPENSADTSGVAVLLTTTELTISVGMISKEKSRLFCEVLGMTTPSSMA